MDLNMVEFAQVDPIRDVNQEEGRKQGSRTAETKAIALFRETERHRERGGGP